MSTHMAKTQPQRRVVTFRPEPELAAAMDALKERDGIPVSEQIRRAMREWLAAKGIVLRGNRWPKKQKR